MKNLLIILSISLPFFAVAAPATQAHRQPEIKIDLASSDVLVWKSIIPPKQDDNKGLALHRHNYSRMLIPLTAGVLQRKNSDGTTTDYPLHIGKPILLTEDTPTGFHTDENLGNSPIELMVVQFNTDSPVSSSPLTEADMVTAVSAMIQ